MTLAHTLLYENSTANEATGVYLDEVTRKVVVKKYSWTDDFVSKNGGKVKVKFPKSVKSLSTIYSPFFDDYDGVSSSLSYVDLNQNSYSIQSQLKSKVNDSTGRFNVEKVSSDLKKNLSKNSPYKIVGDERRSGKRSIALINPVTGHLILQQGKNRKININSLVDNPKDLKKYFSNSSQKEFDFSSPGKIDDYLSRAKRELKRAGINTSSLVNEINKLKNTHIDKISKMKLVKSIGKKGNEKQLFMNLETGTFYYREMDDDEIENDSFFNLNDDQSLERLRDLLTKEDMYSDREFDETYNDIFIKHCKESKSNSVIELNDNIGDILNVTTRLWEDYLVKAVSNKALVLNDGSLVTNILFEDVNHSVEVEVDEFGNIKEMKFSNEDLAKQSGLRVKKIVDGGEVTFKIVSDEDGVEVNQFFFEMEETDISSDPGKAVLAVYVKGAHEKDPLGKFYYDKNIYPVEFNEKGFSNVQKRVQLSSERISDYPQKFKEGDGRGFSTFFFENFFSTKSRKKKIAKEIRNEARSSSKGLNKDGAIVLSNTEIDSAIDLIVDDVERDNPKLKGDVGKLTASVYQHAYDRFAQIVVPKMIKDMLPGEKEEVYKSITDKAMLDFRKCLKSFAEVSNTKGASSCMASFEKEAPVVIGREILALQLDQNGYDLLSEKAKEEYNKCIKEHYDTKAEDLDLIKACIYKSTFKTVDNGLTDIINLTLKNMSKDLDPTGAKSLSVPPPSIIQSRRALRECYISNGYMKAKIFTDHYDINKLKDLEVESFKQGLFSCASKVEEIISTDVTGQFVEESLKDAGLSETQVKLLSKDILENGLDFCIDAQKKKAEILKRSGKYSTVSASSCKSYITLYTTEKVIALSLEEKVGSETWNNVSSDSPSSICFEKTKKIALKELLDDKENVQDIELEATKCLKDTIFWISYHLAKSELGEIFSSEPMYRKIKLSDKQIDLYSKKLQSCFKEKMETYHTVTDITGNLDTIQDSCTVELVMSDEARNDILKPVVEGMLEDNGVSKEISDKTVDEVLDSMKERAQKRMSEEVITFDQLVEEFKNVKGQAVYLVSDATIDGYVREFISDPSKAEQISINLRDDLFQGKNGYRSILAMETDGDKLDLHIQELTKEAAIKLTAVVTTEEAKKLFESGTLKSQSEVDKLSKSAPIVMKKCLDNFKSGDFSEHVNSCIIETKAQVTKGVFEDQLSTILEDSIYSKHFTEKQKKEIFAKHINASLKEEIKKAYESDSLSLFIEEFALKATISAATPVLKGSVAETVYGKGVSESNAPPAKVLLVNRVTEEAGQYLEKCLRTNLKNKKSKSDDTDECINKVRVKATGIILGDILNNVGKYIDKDSVSRNELVDNHISFLNRCSKMNGTKVDGEKFSNRINSCLIENIFDFTANSVKHLSKKNDYLNSVSDKQLEEFRSCITNRKIEYVRKLGDVGVSLQRRNQLYSEIKNGVSFWEKIFSVDELASSSDSTKSILDWSVNSVKVCATTNITTTLLSNLLSSEKSSKALNLNSREYSFALKLSNRIEEFSKQEFGNNFWIDLSSTNTNTQTSQNNTGPSSTINSKKDVSDYINDVMPKLGEYIKKLHAFDRKKALSNLDKLLADISKAKEKKDLTLDDLKAILLNSELIDTVLMSEIAGFVKKEAAVALKSEGLSQSDIDRIVSPQIIKGLFDKRNPEGQKILNSFKQNYIGPILAGEKIEEIPKDLVRDVKVHLSKDTRMGGFVETLAGSIVQKKLDEQMPKNIASQGIAGLIGYNYTDFQWSSLRKRRVPGVDSKDQPVQKAINFFGSKILKPTLLNQNLGNNVEVGFFGGITKSPIIDERKDEFTELIEGLIELE